MKMSFAAVCLGLSVGVGVVVCGSDNVVTKTATVRAAAEIRDVRISQNDGADFLMYRTVYLTDRNEIAGALGFFPREGEAHGTEMPARISALFADIGLDSVVNGIEVRVTYADDRVAYLVVFADGTFWSDGKTEWRLRPGFKEYAMELLARRGVLRQGC